MVTRRTSSDAKRRSNAPRSRPAGRVTKVRSPAPAPSTSQNIYILSDSTGNLARHMLTAVLTQFPAGAFEVRSQLFLYTPQQVDGALDEVAAAPGIVMHAFVEPAVKAQVAKRCADAGLACRDLTGGLAEFLAKASGIAAHPDRARLHDVDHAYDRRIAAIEFALAHDDALGLETLHEADVVLVGVSRTSKTPTSFFLAQQGYKAANIALAMQVPPPAELLRLPRERVAAMIIDPAQLQEIRTRRQTQWQMGTSDYNRGDAVAEEVEWSRRLFQKHGWATFDVTRHAIEETAARIVERLGLASIHKPLPPQTGGGR
jgi:[pyruvate, water dikinase]-phosphate phosphotransferase / [pyruvate, water dikinase] kinase